MGRRDISNSNRFTKACLYFPAITFCHRGNQISNRLQTLALVFVLFFFVSSSTVLLAPRLYFVFLFVQAGLPSASRDSCAKRTKPPTQHSEGSAVLRYLLHCEKKIQCNRGEGCRYRRAHKGARAPGATAVILRGFDNTWLIL